MNKTRFTPTWLLPAALALAGVSLTAAGAASAQSDAVAQRQALMKKVGGAMKTLSGMARGQAPYDAAAAKAAFATMNDAAQKFGTLFPAGSNAGKTAAAAAVWSDRAGFDKKLAGFKADTGMAMKADLAKTESFTPVFGKVAGNCKGCHETYKIDN